MHRTTRTIARLTAGLVTESARIVPIAAVTIAVLATSACANRTVAASAPPVRPAPACDVELGTAPTTGPRVLRSQGVAWTYDVIVAASYDDADPGPLLVDFGSSDRTRHLDDGVPTVTVHPDEPRDIGRWTGDADDVRFVADLLTRLEEQVCFDTSAIYLTGGDDEPNIVDAVVEHLPGRVRRAPPVSPA